MAEPVRARRLTPPEGQQLQRIVRRGSTTTVREVIHRFNDIGLDCLDPNWAGGRPRLLTTNDEVHVIQTATTRPAKFGKPFTRWSIHNLADHLANDPHRPIRIGHVSYRGR